MLRLASPWRRAVATVHWARKKQVWSVREAAMGPVLIWCVVKLASHHCLIHYTLFVDDIKQSGHNHVSMPDHECPETVSHNTSHRLVRASAEGQQARVQHGVHKAPIGLCGVVGAYHDFQSRQKRVLHQHAVLCVDIARCSNKDLTRQDMTITDDSYNFRRRQKKSPRRQ